jgi:methionyl-tRNA formyltransferase
VTYAQKVLKSDARLDWARAAPELEAAVRAFNPRPVAHGEPMHSPCTAAARVNIAAMPWADACTHGARAGWLDGRGAEPRYVRIWAAEALLPGADVMASAVAGAATDAAGTVVGASEQGIDVRTGQGGVSLLCTHL